MDECLIVAQPSVGWIISDGIERYQDLGLPVSM